jgi:hypothetical protein
VVVSAQQATVVLAAVLVQTGQVVRVVVPPSRVALRLLRRVTTAVAAVTGRVRLAQKPTVALVAAAVVVP